MNHGFTMLFILFFGLTACQNRDVSDVTLYQVTTSAYSNELITEGTVKAVDNVTISCPGRISATIVYLIEDGTLVDKGDTVCILENAELSNYYLDRLNYLERAKLQYSKGVVDLEMEYAMLEAQVKSNQAQTSITNLTAIQLAYLSEKQRKIKELEIEKAAIEKRKIESRLKFLEEINEAELKKLRINITNEENKTKDVKDRLDEMIITAPQKGIAIRATSWLTGDKLKETDRAWSNMPLVQLPDLDTMMVEMNLPQTINRRIKVGDSVVYSFDAMPGNVAWGKITRKAPVGNTLSRNSKVIFFEVTASVDSAYKIPDQGISARCRIVLNEIKDTIVIPQIVIFAKDSINMVYVKKNRRFEQREIKLAEQSPKNAVVSGGLRSGEILAMTKPPSGLIEKHVSYLETLDEDGKGQSSVEENGKINKNVPEQVKNENDSL